MEKEELIIPIDKELQRFEKYLARNSRIIFSARFGNGKTCFLNRFFEENKDKYYCITVYPVNYQIEENKDIFELIKRDILIQLLANDSICDDGTILDAGLIAQYYLLNKGTDIVLDLLSCVPLIKTPIKIIQKATNHLKDFKEYKSNANKKEEDKVIGYLNSFSEAKGICEYDTYSELITRCIKQIKEKKKKQVLLLVEDLDRIDPGHLFRILNILTAHMDRVRSYDGDCGWQKNKFDFDKIITVCHYGNIEKIFHHLYGQDTDFDGYIQKFTTRKPFNYSLEKLYKEHIINTIKDSEILKYIDFYQLLLTTIIECKNHSLRMIVSNFNDNFTEALTDKIEDSPYPFLNSFTKFVILSERFEVNTESILKSFFKEQDTFERLCNFIGTNWLFSNRKDHLYFDGFLQICWNQWNKYDQKPNFNLSFRYFSQRLPENDIMTQIRGIRGKCMEFINIDRNKTE